MSIGANWTVLVSGGATFAAVYEVFSKLDDVQSRNSRDFITAWLQRGKTIASDDRWDEFYRYVFDRVFGASHFTLKCAVRSVGLSLLILFLVLSYWWAEHREVFAYTVSDLGRNAADRWGMVGVFALACIVDYMSLLKTRVVLANFSAISKRVSSLGLVILDGVTTTALFVIGFSVASAIWATLFLPYEGTAINQFATYFMTNLPSVASTSFADTPFPIWLLLLCALMTSTWIWLYVLVAASIRLFNWLPGALRITRRVLDIDEHPVRSMGFLIASISGTAVVGTGLLNIVQ